MHTYQHLCHVWKHCIYNFLKVFWKFLFSAAWKNYLRPYQASVVNIWTLVFGLPEVTLSWCEIHLSGQGFGVFQLIHCHKHFEIWREFSVVFWRNKFVMDNLLISLALEFDFDIHTFFRLWDFQLFHWWKFWECDFLFFCHPGTLNSHQALFFWKIGFFQQYYWKM